MQEVTACLVRVALALVLLVQTSVIRSAEPVDCAANGHDPACRGSDHAGDLSSVAGSFTSCSLRRILPRRQLHHLDLQGCRLSDEACRLIAECGDLRELQLAGACLTDKGVAALAGMNGLRLLDLRGTPISDAALLHLKELVDLEFLDLRGTRVSQAAVVRLQLARRKLRILSDGEDVCLLAVAGH